MTVIRKRVARIAGPWRQIDLWTVDHFRDPINAHITALPDIKRTAISYWTIHRKQICPHHVTHVREVPCLFAIAVDGQRLAAATRPKEYADHRERG